MAKKGTFRFKFDGMEEYIKHMEDLGGQATGMAKRALYDGVAVVGESIRQAIEDLPYHPTKGISHKQKQGLLDGLGYGGMRRKNGNWYLKIGFDGYNSVKTKEYPNGQPNAMIAAAVNSGTSRRQKTDFIWKAVRKSRKQATEAMKSRMDKDIEAFEKGK